MLSITVALGLVLASLGVLIYFIHHIATSIQLPQVIASIAGDLSLAIATEVGTAPAAAAPPAGTAAGPSLDELLHQFDGAPVTVPAARTGYLQFVAYDTMVAMATEAGAVIRFLHRPGHFVIEGLPLPWCGRATHGRDLESTDVDDHRAALLEQAEMILAASEATVAAGPTGPTSAAVTTRS